MCPDSFDALAVGHPNTSHEGEVIVELARFPMADKVKFRDGETDGQ